MKKITLLTCLILISNICFGLRPKYVLDNPIAGQLNKSLLYSDDVKITGYLNATDFEYLRTTTTSYPIVKLDLSEVIIQSYTGKGGPNNTALTTYADNYIPSDSFNGYIGFSLTYLILPTSATIIGSNCFANCNFLSTLIFPPNKINSLSFATFAGCYALKKFKIESNIKTINRGVFMYCTGLDTIVVDIKTPIVLPSATYAYSYGDSVFYKVNKQKCVLVVPKDSKVLYQNAPQWKQFKNIVEDEYNNLLSAIKETNVSNLKIYPNPAKSYFKIDGIEDNQNINICDLSGKTVLSKIVENNKAIDIHNLIDGIYIVKINQSYSKIIVSNGK